MAQEQHHDLSGQLTILRSSFPLSHTAACLHIGAELEIHMLLHSKAVQMQDVWVVETSSSSNPRRTHRVKFTCNLCGCTTIAPVNPHAMANGSVFARCGGCDVIHKASFNAPENSLLSIYA